MMKPMTRNECITALRAAGYAGPVSYTVTKLRVLVAQHVAVATAVPTQQAHCQLCLSTDPEDMVTGDQGYSACCNEPVVV